MQISGKSCDLLSASSKEKRERERKIWKKLRERDEETFWFLRSSSNFVLKI